MENTNTHTTADIAHSIWVMLECMLSSPSSDFEDRTLVGAIIKALDRIEKDSSPRLACETLLMVQEQMISGRLRSKAEAHDIASACTELVLRIAEDRENISIAAHEFNWPF